MKTLTTQGKELLIVEVSEESKDIVINVNGFNYWDKTNFGHSLRTEKLPSGKWEYLGEVTREGELNFDCEPYLPFNYKTQKVDFNTTFEQAYPFQTDAIYFLYNVVNGITIPEGKKLIVLEKLNQD